MRIGRQPILNWCSLMRAEAVLVYRQNRSTISGRVDVVALDGSVFWITEGTGNCRMMIHRNDRPEVYRLHA